MATTFGAHGHVFRVRAPDGITERLETVLETLRQDDADPVGEYLVERRDVDWALSWQDELVGHRGATDALLMLLHWHVNLKTIDASTAVRTTFHAAAARSPSGSGVLLAAPMESGKTTTVTGLLRAGWDYLTDEAVAVDADGTMHAYPKPLTIDRGSWPLFPDLQPGVVDPGAVSWLVPVTRTGASVALEAPLRLIVLPCYEAKSVTRYDRLSASAAALALAHSTFHFERRAARDLRCVAALARNVPAYRLVIGDLAKAVHAIDELERACRVVA